MDSLKYVIGKDLVAGLLLCLIMTGQITKLSQIPGKADKTEIKYLASEIELEVGNGDDETKLLCGSVVINRIKSDKWKGSNVEEVVFAKEGPYWQYAKDTRDALKTHKPSTHSKILAKYLLIYGPVCPDNVMYQGMNYNGSGTYMEKDIPGQKKTEKFCYE